MGWEGLGAGGEGDDRGWDGWMASLTWWTWVSVNSGSWWWTGRPGCDSWGRKESDTTERLIWSDLIWPTPVFWPGEFHGLHSPWGRKESDTTERLSLPPLEVEQYHPAGLGAGGFHPLPSDRHLAQCLTPRKRSRNASLPSSSSLCLVGLSLLLWTWALRCGFQGARRCFCLSRHPPLQAGQLAGCCPDLPADPGLSPCRALMGSKDRLDFQEPEGCRWVLCLRAAGSHRWPWFCTPISSPTCVSSLQGEKGSQGEKVSPRNLWPVLPGKLAAPSTLPPGGSSALGCDPGLEDGCWGVILVFLPPTSSLVPGCREPQTLPTSPGCQPRAQPGS